MNTQQRNYALRYLVFFIGLSFMALGVSMTTKADLGTTPISALPYVASLGFTPSIGFFTILLNLGLVGMQIAIMRNKFPKEQYLQIPASLLFGFLIDFWMTVLPDPTQGTYLDQVLFLGAGIFALAFGIFVEVSADVVMMAGEGAVMVLSLVTHRDFGVLKIVFDSTLVLSGILLSFILFQELRGIREGTVLSALLVGVMVKIFFSLLRRFRHQ